MKKLILILLLLSAFATHAQDVLKVCEVRSKCTLQERPTPGTDILKIKKGEKVKIFGKEKGYYKVGYQGHRGFINELFIYDPELVELIEQIKIEKEKKEEIEKQAKIEAAKKAEEEAKERARIIKAEEEAARQEKIEELVVERNKKLIELFGKTKGTRIINEEVWIGMTALEALQSWGEPRDINKTTNAYGVREQWVYGSISNRKYLYFEDGILKTIQE